MKKRIALAAVAALAGGLLVAAPASAASVTEVDYLPSGNVTWTGANEAGPSNFVNLEVNETTTPAPAMLGARIEISGSTILGVTDVVEASAPLAASQVSSTVAIVGNDDTIKVAVTANGTISAKVYWATGVGTFSATAENASFVVSAAPAAPAYNHTTVSGFFGGITGTYKDASGNLFAPKSGSGLVPNPVASFSISQYSSVGDDTLATTSLTKAVTVSLAGVGVIKNEGGLNATYLAYAAGGSAVDTVTVSSDGRSGVATIAIAVEGTVVKTLTVTFYGAPAKFTATVNSAQHQTGDSLTVTVKTVDANGIAVPGGNVANALYTLPANDTATVVLNAGDTPGVETYTVGSSVKYARTITIGNGSAETATVVANFVTAGVKTVVVTADKATYAPGEKATFTLNAKNADGVVVGDAKYALTLSGSTALFGAVTGDLVEIKNGVGTFSAYMPVVAGPVVVSVKLASSDAGTVSVAVVDAAAAAQAAAITALQTNLATLTTTVASLVASMTAQIKVINATLLKIQKAVAALRTQVNKL